MLEIKHFTYKQLRNCSKLLCVLWLFSELLDLNMGDSATVGTKRKSRFESGSVHYEEEPLQKKINIDISLAAAKAAEISKELTSKVVQFTTICRIMLFDNFFLDCLSIFSSWWRCEAYCRKETYVSATATGCSR